VGWLRFRCGEGVAETKTAKQRGRPEGMEDAFYTRLASEPGDRASKATSTRVGTR
jgi:hypothetical protein